MVLRYKIHKRHLTILFGMFLLLLVTFLDNTVFALPVREGMILVFISGLLFATCIGRKSLQLNSFTALFLIGYFLILFNNYEFGRQNYVYELTFTILVLILFTAEKTYSIWQEFFFKFVFVFGLACAVVTYACYFVPKLYTELILPNVQDVYYSSLAYCFKMGYQPGIATHYSSNGMYLALFSGCVFSMYVAQSKKGRLRYILMTVFAMVALLLTAKRAHVLFSIAGMMVVYYMCNVNQKRTRLFKMLAILICALVVFVIVGQFIPAISGFIDRFVEAQKSGDLLNNRSTLYAYALLLFAQNPILGTGWGSFKYLRESFFGEYNNAHNVFLQLLAETGIVGTVVFTSLIIYMLILAIRTFHKMSINRQAYTKVKYRVCAYAVYMQSFFVLYCFTGNPLYDRLIWVPTILSAVTSYYIGRSNEIIRE